MKLKPTRANVVCRMIRQVRQNGIDLPEGARARLPLMRVIHCGPEVTDYHEGDVALFLIDPTTVDPREGFVYGEFDFGGEVLLELPAACLGSVVEGFELTEDWREGITPEDAAAAVEAAKKAQAESKSKVVVPRFPVRH